MLFPISYLSSGKDVVGSKRQRVKFQKVASLKKKGGYLQNLVSHLLRLELQHRCNGVCLSNTLLVPLHSYEPVCPEKNNKINDFNFGSNSAHLKASYICVLGIISSSVVSVSKLPGSP